MCKSRKKEAKIAKTPTKQYNPGMEMDNLNGAICTQEEYEQFLSIHRRFKQISNYTKENCNDLAYIQTELFSDLKGFWPKIITFATKFNLSLKSDLRLMEKVIYNDTIDVGMDRMIIRPDGDIGEILGMGGPDYICWALQQKKWPERDLDALMVALRKALPSKGDNLLKADQQSSKERNSNIMKNSDYLESYQDEDD